MKTSVFAYAPVRSASVAAIGWVKVIVDVPLETGPAQVLGVIATCSGCGRAKAPLVKWPGSLVVSAASPAVLVIVAVVLAV